jgi:hypothetical protein
MTTRQTRRPARPPRPGRRPRFRWHNLDQDSRVIIVSTVFGLLVLLGLFVRTTGRNPPTLAQIVDNWGWSAFGAVVVIGLIVVTIVAGRKR